jgi:hypothetical protein
VGQQDVGKGVRGECRRKHELYVVRITNGRPKTAKLRPVEVVNGKLSRFGPETAEKSLVVLRYSQTKRVKLPKPPQGTGQSAGVGGGSAKVNERSKLRTRTTRPKRPELGFSARLA